MAEIQTSESLIKVIKAAVFLILLTPLVIVPKSFFPFIFWKVILIRILVEIMLLFYLILVLMDKKYQIRRSCLVWIVGIFLGVLVFTTITSLNPYHSFWSNQERMEGLVTTLHFGALFLVLAAVFQKTKDWYWLFRVSFLVSLMAAFYGFLQKINLSWSWIVFGGTDRLSSTFGNPSFLAAYVIPNIFLGAVLMLKAKSRPRRFFYAGCILFELAVLYWTATRGALLGMMAAIFCLLIFLFIQRTKRLFKFIGLALMVFMVVGGLAIYLARDHPFVAKDQTLSRLTSISLRSLTADGSTKTRIMAWQTAYRSWRQRPILGWGLENYNLAYHQNASAEFLELSGNTWFDRAHNKVFDVLVTSGIFGLLSYLAIFGCMIFLLMRRWLRGGRRDWISPIILSLLVAYFLQNLFVFDTPASYLMFFTVLAFVHVRTLKLTPQSSFALDQVHKQGNFAKIKNNSINPNKKNAFVALLVIVTILIMIEVNIKPAMANHDLIMGYASNRAEDMTNYFKKAMFMKTFVQGEARQQFVQVLIRVAIQVQDSNRSLTLIKPMVDLAISQMEEAVAENSQDPSNYLYLARVYRLASSIEGEPAIADKVMNIFQNVKINSSLKSDIYYELANALILSKHYEDALTIYRKIMEFSVDVAAAHWGIGKIMYLTGSPQESIIEMQQAQAMGYFLSKNRASDLLIMSDVCIGLKQFAQAKTLYQDYLKINPDDVQAWAGFAEVYARSGDFPTAQETTKQILRIQPQSGADIEKFIQRLKIIADESGIKNKE